MEKHHISAANINLEITESASMEAKQILLRNMDTTIRMIHGMGLEIVSEGVETKEEYDELLKKGINHIQGYYFSKPLPGEQFLRFLEGHNAHSK